MMESLYRGEGEEGGEGGEGGEGILILRKYVYDA